MPGGVPDDSPRTGRRQAIFLPRVLPGLLLNWRAGGAAPTACAENGAGGIF
jgi:hypothetical protein